MNGKHPNILDLYGAVKREQRVLIFMEYMDGKYTLLSFVVVGHVCQSMLSFNKGEILHPHLELYCTI